MSDGARMIGPLARGHDPVTLVSGALDALLPKGWRADVGHREDFEGAVRAVLHAPAADRAVVYPFVLGYSAIDAGMTIAACKGAIEALRAEVEKTTEGDATG